MMAWASGMKWLATSGALGFGAYTAWKHLGQEHFEATVTRTPKRDYDRVLKVPTREEQLQALQGQEEYDLLVIGGGVTGCGVALDAVTRGLKTALVEKDDFSSGTSSRSTKLIHGGVRYLKKAVFNLDYEQYRLVREALHERANLLAIAPHLSQPLPIMLPVYKWWQAPYFYAGIKMYDMVSGKQLLKKSYFVSKSKALEQFPMLKEDMLCGAIIYYDGQHNDSRMNLSVALTAADRGARVANHVQVTALLKEREGGREVVRGACVRDVLSGKEWEVRAKVVVNATGPFTDTIRHMDDSSLPDMCQLSAGIHIVLPSYYSPLSMGLLDPATADGRVIFFLPWEGATIAGTTDTPTELTDSPQPREEDIRFILSEIKHYLNPNLSVRRGDVLAAWSGLRPLVTDPSAKNTQSIARNHVIVVSDSDLVTIAGGKWTTYRSMASDAVDKALCVGGFRDAGPCQTDGLVLVGGEGWFPTLFIRLIQDHGLDVEVARHLASSYGDKAEEVARMASLTGKRWPVMGHRLSPEFPYIEAEVKYAVKEYARTAVDVLARRTRLAFLNVQAAEEALPRIVEIMAQELGWTAATKASQLKEARVFLQSMGYKVRAEVRDVPISLSYQEALGYSKTFKSFDKDKDGHISIHDLRKALQEMGEKVTEDQLHELIAEVDINQNCTIEEEEFLQLMSALKTGEVSNSRLASIVHTQQKRDMIPVDRSGGGL